jgi:hypothetical protein
MLQLQPRKTSATVFFSNPGSWVCGLTDLRYFVCNCCMGNVLLFAPIARNPPRAVLLKVANNPCGARFRRSVTDFDLALIILHLHGSMAPYCPTLELKCEWLAAAPLPHLRSDADTAPPTAPNPQTRGRTSRSARSSTRRACRWRPSTCRSPRSTSQKSYDGYCSPTVASCGPR